MAVGLAALAGFVDALGFLKLKGLFVSFMSGNSTRMAVGIIDPAAGGLFAAALIATFVGGVMAGAIIGRWAGPYRMQAVMASVTILLAAAALAATAAAATVLTTLLMAGAMGTANAVFERDGEVSVGVTYMTGTLVKLGQHLASALTGGPRFNWLPYLLLWLGLIGGAMAGAATYGVLDLKALWAAASGAAVLTLGARRLGRSSAE